MKKFIIAIFLIILGTNLGCEGSLLNHNNKISADIYLTKNGKSFPVWFERKLDLELKKIIINDMRMIFQLVKNIEVVQRKNTVEKVKYLNYEGKVMLPSKFIPKTIEDKIQFGKVIHKNGKDYVFVSETIIEQYEDMFKKRRYYKKMQKEVNSFVDFFNNIVNLDIKNMPDVSDIFWSKHHQSKEYSTEEIKEFKSEFKKSFGSTKLLYPPLISIDVFPVDHGGAKGELIAETLLVYEREHLEPDYLMVPLIKDDGRWKLALEMLE